MPKWLIVLLAIWIPAIGLGAAYYFSEEQAAKRLINAEIERLNATTRTKDVAGLQAYLENILTENATIEFNVAQTTFGTLAMGGQPIVSKQKFTRADFIRFVTLNLDTTENYTFSTKLLDFTYKDGAFTANTHSGGNGDGKEYSASVRIPTNYYVQIGCVHKGKIAQLRVQISDLLCTATLQQRPKGPVSPDQLRDIITRP